MKPDLGRIAKWLFGCLCGLAVGVAQAQTETAKDWETCARQTVAAEQEKGIPQHLLTAISLAETGRWNDTRSASLAWPWTVTSGGEGRFFPTRQAALGEVRRLKAAGVTNIDVGCMQVNLFYHGDEFASIEAAMDPATNVAYAARFLEKLKTDDRSWLEAAANYHSSNSETNRPYRLKVVKLWNQVRRDGLPTLAEDETQRPRDQTAAMLATGTGGAEIDVERTIDLNDALRRRKMETRELTTEERRQAQLAAWRNQRHQSDLLAANAAQQRAELARKVADTLRKAEQTHKEVFADRRREQLERWRRSGVLRSGGLDPS